MATTAEQLLKLDMQTKDRQIAAQIAADNALDAYRNKHMELIEQGQLAQQADQYAKDYALQQGKFTFEKELGLRQITNTEQAQAFSQQMATRQQDFDERWKASEQTGFVDGTPTLDREKFWESQRQFDVNTVMNAPRGPADWGAYTTRLRGLNASGALPGIIGNLVTNQPIAEYSNAGQQTPPVMTSTQMAMLATGQGGPGSWGQGAGQAPAYSQAAGGQQPGYSQAAQMFGLGGMQPQPQVSGRDVSYQQFRKLTPDEQQMAVGYAGEGQGGFMPQSEADFMDQMKDAAPQFRPSAQSRFSGMG